ncbi:MAG TPA: CoA transferase [Dehalococcoidia bacterium]|nr:CoA transferase [Dehalococcoidia bacterium]
MESALQGVRILDFTRALAGPFATMLLADLGAEVIKVEPPGSREEHEGPFAYKGMHFYFLSVNRSKKSLALDIAKPEGREVLHDLVRSSDVVIDNFRPGVPKRLGLDYETLAAVNPRIICTSITGFGSLGPYRDRPAYDVCVQAMSGAVSISGNAEERPVRNGVAVADQGASFTAVAGTIAALYQRERTGKGQKVETSLLESMVYQLAYEIALYTVSGTVLKNIGSSHVFALPYGIYETSDGHIAIAAPFKFEALCCAIERVDLLQDERFDKTSKLAINREALDQELMEAFRHRSTDDWLQRLDEADVPCETVRDIAEAIEHPQVQATEMIVPVPHVLGGEVRLVGNPVHLSETPDEIKGRYSTPPLLGQHTEEVLMGVLGYSRERLEELRAREVIS